MATARARATETPDASVTGPILSCIEGMRCEMRDAHKRQGERMERIETGQHRLERILLGPDDSPEKGLAVRLKSVEEDIEDTKDKRKWWERTILAGVIASLLTATKALFGGRGAQIP